jgi:uncharacterized protein YndB with AHSA1/START domain
VNGTADVSRSVTLDASPRAVWEALTDARLLSSWFDAEVEIDVRTAGPVRFRFPDGSERRGVIEIVDPPRRLTFRWRPIDEPGEPSVVELILHPDGGGTQLVVTELRGLLRPEATLEASAR